MQLKNAFSLFLLQLDQFNLGLPHRRYYLEPDFRKEFNAYKTFIKDIAMYLGADSQTAEQDVDDIMEFETYMANVSFTFAIYNCERE